jgi:hypothetical protein
MRIRLTFCAILLLLMSSLGFAGVPDTDVIVKGMLDAVGGEKAFAGLGVLEISISEEETKTDGSRRKKQYTAYMDTGNLANVRLDLPGDIVVGRSGDNAWATRSGVVDDRPQTPQMASAMINQRIFPMFLPHTLKMNGVMLSEATETSFEGKPAWRIAVSFAEKFFIAPAMGTTWQLYVNRSDHSVLAIEFLPPPEFRAVATEGVRYRILRSTELDGATIPDQVFLDGIDPDGSPTGHVRVTRMSFTRDPAEDQRLFTDPDLLE